MPELQRAVDSNPGFALVTVVFNGRLERAARTAAANRLRAPVLKGTRALRKKLRVRSVPTTMILDARGRILRVLVGARTADAFEQAMREI